MVHAHSPHGPHPFPLVCFLFVIASTSLSRAEDRLDSAGDDTRRAVSSELATSEPSTTATTDSSTLDAPSGASPLNQELAIVATIPDDPAPDETRDEDEDAAVGDASRTRPSPDEDPGPEAAPATAELVPAEPVDEKPKVPKPKPGTNSLGGFLDFNLYPYMTKVDTDNSFTLNAFAKLPYGFSYFGLLNIGNEAGAPPLVDTNSYYTEQNLRFTPSGLVPLDLTIQWNMRSGDQNDRLRFGVRWRINNTPFIEKLFQAIHLAYSINFHAFQLDHEEEYVWQMEHVWKLSTPYLDDRIYINGFADHTFNGAVPDGAPKAPLILEAQLGLRLVEQLHAVAEYRIMQYRVGDETNIALGAEYVVEW